MVVVRDIAMSMKDSKGFQSLEAFLPASCVAIPDEPGVLKRLLSFVAERGMLAHLVLQFMLVALPFYPLGQLLVLGVMVRDKEMSVFGAEREEFLKALVPLSRLELARSLGGMHRVGLLESTLRCHLWRRRRGTDKLRRQEGSKILGRDAVRLRIKAGGGRHGWRCDAIDNGSGANRRGFNGKIKVVEPGGLIHHLLSLLKH